MPRLQPWLMCLLLLAGCAGDSNQGDLKAGANGEPLAHNDASGGIRGMILDESDQPVANATIGLGEGIGQRVANTTALGSFEFLNVAPGTYTLFVQALGFHSEAKPVAVAAKEVVEVTIALRTIGLDEGTPKEASIYQVTTVGGWFQIPYAEAQKAMPPGFTARPHILAASNGQTAEYAFYLTQYANGTFGGTALAGGVWAFEVLNVDTTTGHSAGATVDFILLRSYASEPAFQAILNSWRLPTRLGTVTAQQSIGAGASQGTGSVDAEGARFRLTVADGGSQESLTSGSLTVRFFGIENGTILNYVDIAATNVLYAILGGARLEDVAATHFTPLSPVGEGYLQWGASAKQVLGLVPARKV